MTKEGVIALHSNTLARAVHPDRAPNPPAQTIQPRPKPTQIAADDSW